MKVELDKLSETELIALKTRIAQRLRFLNETRAHTAMLEFAIGERVSFLYAGRQLVFGVLTRYNRKTVTVVSDTGDHWNVEPTALRRTRHRIPLTSGNVLPLHRK